MGGLVIPQTVRTQDYSQVAIPGRQQMVGNGGKVIKVNAGGNGYELGDGGGGGAFPIGMTRLQSASVAQSASGAGRRADAGGAWSVDTEYLAPAAAAPPITPDAAGGGGFTFDAAGWYVVRFRWLGRFGDPATAPARVRFQLSHDNVFFNAYQSVPVEFPDEGGDTTNKTFDSDFVSRPMFISAGEHMEGHWLWAGAQLATDGGHRVVVEIARIGA